MEPSDSASSTDSTFVPKQFFSIDAVIVPFEILQLRKLSNNKPRPIKIVFSSSADVFFYSLVEHKLYEVLRSLANTSLIQHKHIFKMSSIG